LSALGLAAAPERVEVMAPLHRPVAALSRQLLHDVFQPLLSQGAAQLPGAGLNRYADCRFLGQGYEVTVPAPADDPAAIAAAFVAAHQTRYGSGGTAAAVEVVNVRVVAERPGASARFANGGKGARPSPGRREIALRAGAVTRRVTAAVWPLDELPAGVTIPGPAILAGGDATALIEPGWQGRVHASGAIVVERA